MPFNENHPVINPPNGNPVLWRYMDIPSFMAMITNKELTFVRADLFEDKFEGVLPKLTSTLIDIATQKQVKDGKLKFIRGNLSDTITKMSKVSTYLNCWTMEDHEMVHMWKIYSKEFGVAIKTNYDKLKSSIKTDETIYPTKIEYVEFNNSIIDWKSNTLTAFTIKRREYKSEKEFRLLIPHPKLISDKIKVLSEKHGGEKINQIRNEMHINTPVIKCPVEIKNLIESIQVSPYAPDWYLELIKNVAKDYKLEVQQINKSEL